MVNGLKSKLKNMYFNQLDSKVKLKTTENMSTPCWIFPHYNQQALQTSISLLPPEGSVVSHIEIKI